MPCSTGKRGKQMRNIILCGFMGCGKTTVGQHLARLTGKCCIQKDHEILSRKRVDIAPEGERAAAG